MNFIVRKNAQPLFTGLALCFAVMLSACSSSEKSDSPAVEYYGDASRGTSLVIPPDLTQTDPSKNIRLPDAPDSAAGSGGVLSNSNVLAEPGNVKMMRDGQQRWLVVNEPPAEVWPQLVEFWEKDGITLVTKNPQSGVIETDWMTNYADMGSSVEKIFMGLINKLTTTGQRDKYRVRLDFGQQDGTSEIYVSQQGMEEVAISVADHQKKVPDYKWVKRPTDTGLEIEIMRQIMVYLGVDENTADKMVEQDVSRREQHARLLIEDTDEPILIVEDSFPRAWQRVGLALDRLGYTIFGRNREQGGYVVEFADVDIAKAEKPGFFSRIFGNDDENVGDINYRVQVRLIPQNEEKTAVAIATEDGVHDNSETAISMLEQLYDQLK